MRKQGKNVIDVDYDRKEIVGAIRKQIQSERPKGEQLYGDGNAGIRIAKLLNEIGPISKQKTICY